MPMWLGELLNLEPCKNLQCLYYLLVNIPMGLILLGITAEGNPRFIYSMFETIPASATVGVTAEFNTRVTKLASAS